MHIRDVYLFLSSSAAGGAANAEISQDVEVMQQNSCLQLTLSPPIPLRLYTLPHWPNPPFLFF